jgi:hypothetical protein
MTAPVIHLPDATSAPRPAAAAQFAARNRARNRWRRSWPLLAALLLLPALLLASGRVTGWTGNDRGYEVSVPVILRPHDPALWSMANAENFAAAQAIDPELPDPFAIAAPLPNVPGATDATLSVTSTPPSAMPQRLEAYTGPVARPYVFRGATATDTARAHYCLTATLYYEAASETDDGMRGVAQVVLNRTRHPSFPGTVCGVVFQGSQRAIVCQFTFSCDGSMARTPARGPWQRASRIAAEALAGRVFAPVGLATHYHTQAVWPSWGRSLAMTNVIGAHIFHRWRGRYGMPGAFLRPYSGHEPAPGPYLPIAAQLAARAGRAAPATTLAPLPGTIDQAAMAAIEAARASAGTSTAATPGAVPASGPAVGAAAAAAVVPGFTPAAPPRSAPPTYADPRLAGSGSVREEYRNSGTAITR